MLNERPHILSLLFLLVLIGCKKNDSDFDRNNSLVSDTSTFLYSASYVSHTSSQLTIQLDLVTIEGFTSSVNNPSERYIPTKPNFNIDLDFQNNFNQPVTTASNYSTVFMFNGNTSQWYQDDRIGFYLRRYLELKDANTAHVAMTSFDQQQHNDLIWHVENTGNLFGNTWEYMMDEFYTISHYDPSVDNYYTSSPQVLFDHLNGVMDQVNTDPGFTGRRSITIISGRDFEDGSLIDSEVTDLIGKAGNMQISINLFGTGFNTDIQRLALETGGFVCKPQEIYPSPNPVEFGPRIVSDMGVFMINLDDILRGNLTSHRCLMTATYTDGSFFNSGDRISYPINYNGYIFFIDLVIP